MSAPKWAVELVERVCADQGIEVPELTWRRSAERRAIYRIQRSSGFSYRYGWTPGRAENLRRGCDPEHWTIIESVEPRPTFSSGSYHSNAHRIVLTAGSDRRDQKLVLLHELAHAATPGEHHSETFWVRAFANFKEYGIPLRAAYAREKNYRKAAIVGYVAAKSGRTGQ